MMNKKYEAFINGKTIKADTNYRPDIITIDEKEYSMDLFCQANGYSWKTSGNGNVLYYQSEDGSQVSFEQKMLTKRLKPQKRYAVDTDHIYEWYGKEFTEEEIEKAQEDGLTFTEISDLAYAWSTPIEELMEEVHEIEKGGFNCGN